MTREFENLLDAGFAGLPLSLDKKQKEQFFEFYEILISANKVTNLTAITDMEEVISRHFVDSLLPVLALPDLGDGGITAIDIGTGAGFPGIPLKIAFPNIEITLVDSVGKKTSFLKEAVSELGLVGVEIVTGRAEELGREPAYREKFDLCFSRAVAKLPTLSELCLPFVRTDGIFVAFKSDTAGEEIAESENAIRILGGKVLSTLVYPLPGTDAQTMLAVIEKTSPVPEKYPRRTGIPGKRPLK